MSIKWLILYCVAALAVLLTDGRRVYDRGRELEEPRSFVFRLRLQTFLYPLLFLAFGMLCATRLQENTYDTLVYVNWYERISALPFWQRDGFYGPGFELLGKICGVWLKADVKVFFFLVAEVHILLAWLAFRDTVVPGNYGFILYLAFLGLYYSFIVLRQGLAVCCAVLAYRRMDTSKWKALLLAALGYLFHESALVAMAVVLVFGGGRVLRLSRRGAWAALILAAVMYLTGATERFIIPVLQRLLELFNLVDAGTFHKYILYFEPDQFQQDLSLLYLLYFAVTGGIIDLVWKYEGWQDWLRRWGMLLAVNLTGLLFLGFFSRISASVRVMEIMTPATYAFLIPAALENLHKRDRTLILCGLFAFLTFYQLRIILGPTSFY